MFRVCFHDKVLRYSEVSFRTGENIVYNKREVEFFPNEKERKTKTLQSIIIVRARNKRHSDIFFFFQRRSHALFIWRVYIRSQILRLSRAAILHPGPFLCFMINVLKVLCILPRVHINYRLAEAITLQDPLSRLQAPLHRFLFRVPKRLHSSFFFQKKRNKF